MNAVQDGLDLFMQVGGRAGRDLAEARAHSEPANWIGFRV